MAEIAAQTRELWGEGRTLDGYRRLLAEQRERSGGDMQHAALLDGRGRVVSSLKRYRLALAFGGQALPALGIGAVFTPPSARGRGLAAKLIGHALAEARDEGLQAALLFSDIEPAYYAQMGFVLLPHQLWSAPVSTLPAAEPALDAEATEEVGPLVPLYRKSLLPESLRASRTADGWRYWAWRNRLQVSQRLLERGRLVGYLTVVHRDGLLWVGDVAAPEVERRRVMATLRHLAERVGATRVAGWLPPELAGPPFAAQERTRCIPMVAPLDGELGDWRPELAHFSSLDCF